MAYTSLAASLRFRFIDTNMKGERAMNARAFRSMPGCFFRKLNEVGGP